MAQPVPTLVDSNHITVLVSGEQKKIHLWGLQKNNDFLLSFHCTVLTIKV
jgi:hypothetical protein